MHCVSHIQRCQFPLRVHFHNIHLQVGYFRIKREATQLSTQFVQKVRGRMQIKHHIFIIALKYTCHFRNIPPCNVYT